MAKLLKLRRGTTSQHSSFTGAEGEVTVDTDKETLVVHDGSTAGGHPVAAEDLANVSSSDITGRLSSGSIATAKIANGAIIGTKIADDAVGTAQIADNAVNSARLATDSVTSGKIVNSNVTRAKIANSAINSDKLDNGAVTFAKFQNIDQNRIVGRTAVGSGSATTLTAANVRSMINVENGATADQTKSDIDALNINADTVDSLHASSFVRSDADDSLTGVYNYNSTSGYPIVIGNTSGANDAHLLLRGSANPYVRFRENNADKAYIQWNSGGYLEIYNEETSRSIRIRDGSTGLKWNEGGTERTIWHAGNHGSGSGLDADTLDGIQGSNFVRSDQGDTLNGAYTFNTGTNEKIVLQGSNDPYIRWKEGTTNRAYIQWSSSPNELILVNEETGEQLRIGNGANGLKFKEGGTERTVWHSGNDGSGSGLDADLLDGISSGSFLRSDTADQTNGDITFNGGAGAITVTGGSDIRLSNGSWSGDTCKIQHHDNYLYIVGGSNGHILRDTSGHNNLILDANGNGTFIGNVTAYSDARLKTDIHTINDALGICGKLRGVSYNWIRDGKPSIGVIAQEVEEVLPEIVLRNVDTDPATGETTEIKSVDYGKIVGVLINAINELKAEVDELKGGK